jgi:hypothetical protein
MWGISMSHRNCAHYFDEYMKCYVEADIPERQCKMWKEDYGECKTRDKEMERIKMIRNEKRRKENQ